MRTLYKKLFVLVVLMNLLIACEKGKSEMISKKWKVTELDLSGTKLTGDQVNMMYSFNPDGTFFRTEDGKTEDGSWSLSKDGKSLTLTFNDKELKPAQKSVEQLSEERLVISGEEFSMQRTLTMVPAEDK